MEFKNAFAGRGKKIAIGVAAVAVVAGATTGSAVAAKQITTSQIKNGTIQTRDLTKNNFARFTATENTVSAVTPANPLAGNRQVVNIPTGPTPQPLAQVTLNRGTYHVSGTAQFYSASDSGRGEVTVSGLANSLGTFYTDTIPSGTGLPAQTGFSGTVTITTDNTPVIVYGTISGPNAGQAGAQISATQFKYVKLFNHGNK